jgi:hypothetical protein
MCITRSVLQEAHHRKQRADAAHGIGQREPVGEVELADQGKRLAAIG